MDDFQQKLEYEYRKQRYEAYSREHEALHSGVLEISKRYDSAILALAGGGLALSVTFMEKIAPHPAPWTLLLLGLAWLFLIGALLFELHALATAQTATNEQIGALDNDYRRYLDDLQCSGRTPVSMRRDPSNRIEAEKLKQRIRVLSRASLVALTVGVLLLCAFTFLNLPYADASPKFIKETGDRNMSKYVNESRGNYVPPKRMLPPPPPPMPTRSTQQDVPASSGGKEPPKPVR